MRPINNRWKGMLTTGNAEEVAKVIDKMLGRRRFTYTFVRPSMLPKIDAQHPAIIDTRVDVHTGLKLRRSYGGERVKAINVNVDTDGARLNINTTEYFCMYDTQLAGDGAPYDYTYKNPYFAFDGDRVTIKWQTPCGDQAVDVFTLEVR